MKTKNRPLNGVALVFIAIVVLHGGAFAAVTFNGETYVPAKSIHTRTQDAQTFIRASESNDHWTRRLAVRYLPYDQDPGDYAQAVKESLLLYEPKAVVTLDRLNEGSQVQLDYRGTDGDTHIVDIRHRTGGLVIREITTHETVGPQRARWKQELTGADWPLTTADPQMDLDWKKAIDMIRWYIHAPHIFVEKKLVDQPFTLAHRPAPPEHAWLYIRPNAVLDTAEFPVFLDAVRAYRATGLDLKKQPNLREKWLSQLLEPSGGWPLEPGWRTPIDGLRYLNIKGTPVGDEVAPTLARMIPMQSLILNDQITDEGLRLIATALVHLMKFRPGGPKITDRGLAALSGLHSLHRLDLSDTSVTDKGVAALKGLPLIEVDLGTGIGDGALQTLSTIPTLVHLELMKSHVTAKGISLLKLFTTLHTLFIGDPMDDQGAKILAQIPSIRRLDITGSRVTDEGVKTLAALKDLQELALTRTAVTDQGIAALAHLQKLRYLEVSETKVTPKGIGQLAGLPELDVVSFTFAGSPTLGDLKPLGNLPALQTVIVNGQPLNHEAVTYIRQHGGTTAPLHATLWSALAWADVMPTSLTDSTPISTLVDKSSPRALNDSGLHRIHDVESDLDHVIPDVASPKIETQEDTAENFLGEFTVNAAPAKIK